MKAQGSPMISFPMYDFFCSKLFVAVFNKSPHLHSIDLRNNKLQSVSFLFPFYVCVHVVDGDSEEKSGFVIQSYMYVLQINSYEFADCPHLTNVDLSHNSITTIVKVSTGRSKKDSTFRAPELFVNCGVIV